MSEKNPLEILKEIGENLSAQNRELSELLKKNKSVVAENSQIKESILTSLGQIDKGNQIRLELYERIRTDINEDVSKFIDITEEFPKKMEQEMKNLKLPDVDLSLNHKDLVALEQTKKELKSFNNKLYWSAIILFLSVCILTGMGFFAREFYKNSISTKEKVLEEIKQQGLTIISKEEYQAYKNERRMLYEWQKGNPNDSKSYRNFREGKHKMFPKESIFKNFDVNDLNLME